MELALYGRPRLRAAFNLLLVGLAVGLLCWLLVKIGLGANAAFGQTAAPMPVTVTPSDSLVINVGAIVTTILAWARDILVAAAGLAASVCLPAGLRMFVTNNILSHAVDYAIGAVEGAAKDREISIPIANEVIAEAVRYVIARKPGVANRLGDDLKAALLARLTQKVILPPAAVQGATLGTAVPGARDPAGNGAVSIAIAIAGALLLGGGLMGCNIGGTSTTAATGSRVDLNQLATVGCALAQVAGDMAGKIADVADASAGAKGGIVLGREVLDTACAALIRAGGIVHPATAASVSATTTPAK